MAEPLDFTDVPQEPVPVPVPVPVPAPVLEPEAIPEPEPLILLPALRIINRRANIAQQLEILSIDPQDDGSFLVFTADPH